MFFPMAKEKRLILSLRQYAERIGVNYKTAYKWLQAGKLDGCFTQQKRTYRIDVEKAEEQRRSQMTLSQLVQSERQRRQRFNEPPMTPEEESELLAKYGHSAPAYAQNEDIGGFGPITGNPLHVAQTRQRVFQALQAELDYRQSAGELVHVEQMGKMLFEAARAFRNAAQALAPRLIPTIIKDPDQRHEAMVRTNEEVNVMLDELVGELERIAGRRLPAESDA